MTAREGGPPVDVGDRVQTPAGTAGEVVRVRWVPPGPWRLTPSRHRPGYWLAVVAEDTGVHEGVEMPYDAAQLRAEPR